MSCMANTKHMLTNRDEYCLRASQYSEIITLQEFVAANSSSRHIQVSATKDLLAHYMDVHQRREKEIDKWKKLFFVAKATAKMLQKGIETTVCTKKNAHLQDWLELGKT